MEYGNANYEKIKMGWRSPPLERAAMSALSWLLLISPLYFLGVPVMLMLASLAMTHPLYCLLDRKRLIVDFVKADSSGVLVTSRYFPTITATETRVTRSLPWNSLQFVLGEGYEDETEEPTYYAAKLRLDTAFPEFRRKEIPVSGRFDTPDAAQKCVDQWNACRGNQ